jgi:glycosyltransferase involved in cell wall biosynthesis
MNCPVIATAHGGALDIVQPGVSGWLVPLENAEALGEAIVESSREKLTGLRDYALSHFSLAQMADKTIAVYKEVSEIKGNVKI